MILWNLITIALIIATIIEARNNGWKWPKVSSFAYVTLAWFVGSILLYLIR